MTDAISAMVMAARAAARGVPVRALAADRCPTCGRSAENPYRRRDTRQTIVEGCVDAHHTGALVPFSSSYDWHWRAPACRSRQITLAMLRAL